jgi:hypothetical protein
MNIPAKITSENDIEWSYVIIKLIINSFLNYIFHSF